MFSSSNHLNIHEHQEDGEIGYKASITLGLAPQYKSMRHQHARVLRPPVGSIHTLSSNPLLLGILTFRPSDSRVANDQPYASGPDSKSCTKDGPLSKEVFCGYAQPKLSRDGMGYKCIPCLMLRWIGQGGTDCIAEEIGPPGNNNAGHYCPSWIASI